MHTQSRRLGAGLLAACCALTPASAFVPAAIRGAGLRAHPAVAAGPAHR